MSALLDGVRRKDGRGKPSPTQSALGARLSACQSLEGEPRVTELRGRYFKYIHDDLFEWAYVQTGSTICVYMYEPVQRGLGYAEATTFLEAMRADVETERSVESD